MIEIIVPMASRFANPSREWPARLPVAPKELVNLIEDAMVDFGPDGHCDGADVIGALVLRWFYENFRDFT
jgi:hypothetical protein